MNFSYPFCHSCTIWDCTMYNLRCLPFTGIRSYPSKNAVIVSRPLLQSNDKNPKRLFWRISEHLLLIIVNQRFSKENCKDLSVISVTISNSAICAGLWTHFVDWLWFQTLWLLALYVCVCVFNEKTLTAFWVSVGGPPPPPSLLSGQTCFQPASWFWPNFYCFASNLEKFFDAQVSYVREGFK